jgi:glycosyltransferase involved in cell wall biosynthesis
LQTRLENTPYAFVVSASQFSKVAEMQQEAGCRRAPVCGLVHAVCMPGLWWQYARIALNCEECDRLVVTSRAGRRAIETILDLSRERLQQKVNGAGWTRPMPTVVDIPLGTHIPPETALDRRHARALLQLPQDAFVLLSLGRFSEHYKADLDVLIQAFLQVSAPGVDLRLVLAGQSSDDGHMAYVRSRVAKLGSRCLILENFPDYVKSTILAAADACVSVADSIQETFGLVLVEAMAHARPVIASSWSGYRDLVIDGETGVLVRTAWSNEPGISDIFSFADFVDAGELAHRAAQRTIIDVGGLVDAIETFARNPSLGRRFGEAGRRRAMALYAWPEIARRFLSLWTEQSEAVKNSRTPLASSMDYNSVFQHYADEGLCADHAVSPSGRAQAEMEPELMELLNAVSPQRAAEIKELWRSYHSRAARLTELRDRGYSIDAIVWLAKKGFWRIIPLPP